MPRIVSAFIICVCAMAASGCTAMQPGGGSAAATDNVAGTLIGRSKTPGLCIYRSRSGPTYTAPCR